jgi:diguanylate cyclase (GGDEF)-like protein
MRIKQFVIIMFVLYAFIVCGGLLLYRLFIVFPQLEDQTRLRHHSDFRALEQSFISEKNNLSLLLYDWAKWDDMYHFMDLTSLDFESSNLVESLLSDMSLNGFYIFNSKKQLQIGIEIEQPGRLISNLSDLPSKRARIFSLIVWPSDDDLYCKFQYLSSTLSLFCLSTIQNSNEDKPGNGYLAFSRPIDDSELKTLTGANFSLLDKASVKGLQSIEDALSNQAISSRYQMGIFDEITGNMCFGIEVNYDPKHLPVPIDYLTMVIMLVLLLLPIIILYSITRIILNPLTNMSEFILAMKKGKETKALPHSSFILEVNLFTTALTDLLSHVNDERRMLENKSMTDSLTGIRNRRAFDEEVDDMWRTSSRQEKSIAIILSGVDYFKRFNDTAGHQQGDDALKAIALALQSGCRRSSDKIYRYGGEEFVMTVQLESSQDIETVISTLQSCVSELQYPHPDSPISPCLTVSFGVCLIPLSGEWMQYCDYMEAVRIADNALYEAKKNGRNGYALHLLSKGSQPLLP